MTHAPHLYLLITKYCILLCRTAGTSPTPVPPHCCAALQVPAPLLCRTPGTSPTLLHQPHSCTAGTSPTAVPHCRYQPHCCTAGTSPTPVPHCRYQPLRCAALQVPAPLLCALQVPAPPLCRTAGTSPTAVLHCRYQPHCQQHKMCIKLEEVLGFIGHFRGEHYFPCDIHSEMSRLPGPPHDFGPKPDHNFIKFVRRRGYNGMYAPYEQRRGPPPG